MHLRRFLFVLLGALCAACTSTYSLPAVDTSLPPAERETDYLRRALEAQHPNPYSHCGAPKFSSALAAAAARLREDDPRAWHLEIRKLVALVGDSHTHVAGLGPFESSVAPFLLRHFADGWWIVGSVEGFDHLVGQRVSRFDGHTMDEVIAAVRPYASFDNHATLIGVVPGFLMRPEFLHAIGLTGSADRTDLELEDLQGASHVESVPTVAGNRSLRVILEKPDGSAPWLIRNLDRSYWHEFIADDVLYIRYRNCAEDPARPIQAFADEIAASLSMRRPRMCVVDLRDNGGGDSDVFQPVERVLARADVRAHTALWVVTNAGTYSSATIHAWRLRHDAGARLAGEPSAQRPNSYGDIREFVLPVSGIHVWCSIKTFRMVPGDPEVLAVDLPIATRGEDWFHVRDPVIARLLAD